VHFAAKYSVFLAKVMGKIFCGKW